jgi:hypothetical protein
MRSRRPSYRTSLICVAGTHRIDSGGRLGVVNFSRGRALYALMRFVVGCSNGVQFPLVANLWQSLTDCIRLGMNFKRGGGC